MSASRNDFELTEIIFSSGNADKAIRELSWII